MIARLSLAALVPLALGDFSYDYNVPTTAPTIDGEAAADESGGSVALSADGGRLAVGAPFNDGTGADSGHARVYDVC